MSIDPLNVPKERRLQAWVILGAAILFYLYEFVLQSSPGVITQELLQDFNLDAASLSVMSAFFFYAYAPTQLVGGVLYDRFGPRLLITIACTICTLGTACFAFGNSVGFLSAGRFCMGLGGAFSFVGVLILAARWFPLRHFALIAGILQMLGAFAAIGGQVPLAAAVAEWGWRPCFHVLLVFGIALIFGVFIFIRDWPKATLAAMREQAEMNNPAAKVPLMESLRVVFSKAQTYWMAIYSFAIWAPIVVFAALWGIPFIKATYQLTTTVASTVGMMVWLGVAFGSPFFGWWSSKISKRKLPLMMSALLGVISAIIVVYISIPLWAMYIVLFVFGLGASGQSLIFAVVQDNNSPKYSGTAMGFNNLAVVAGGAVLQPLAGYLIHFHWSGLMQAGVPAYQVADFRYALLLLPICYGVAFIFSWMFIRETNGKAQYE